MPKVSVTSIDKSPIVPPPPGASESVESRAIFARAGDPIHTALHTLAAGANLAVVGEPTDRMVYIWKGAVQAGGVRLAAGSSAIVERQARLELIAGAEGASLIAFHLQHRPESDDRAGGHVHLLPAQRVPRRESVNGQPVGAGLHADAACPTCSVWLHENTHSVGSGETEVHSHSEDEVIFITDGEVRLGNKLFGAGTAIAVAAHTNYGFSTGPHGMRFVNFRGASPTYCKADRTLVLDEGSFWREVLGSPEYLEPSAA